MPVGELPVIELLLKWLRRNGISEVVVTTGYLGHLIKSLCGNGETWDMQITYSEETQPLGTVGALDLVRDHLDETFLVLNGDLITDMNLRSFIHFHKSHGDLLTVGTTQKRVHVDMGVLETAEDHRITDFREKPTLSYTVNMGIYCMEPGILDMIPKGVPFGFDDLMYQMLDNGQSAHAYRHDGQWLDIGRPEDFTRAQEMADGEDMPMRGV
jgi:mannose-1-phosphate guanylyltransferase